MENSSIKEPNTPITVMWNEFCCPKCGSSRFGGLPTRHCHGTVLGADGQMKLLPCKFKWDQSDDWKYFRLVIKAGSPDDRGLEIAENAVRRWILTGEASPQ